jgi:hypothetical protein
MVLIPIHSIAPIAPIIEIETILVDHRKVRRVVLRRKVFRVAVHRKALHRRDLRRDHRVAVLLKGLREHRKVRLEAVLLKDLRALRSALARASLTRLRSMEPLALRLLFLLLAHLVQAVQAK